MGLFSKKDGGAKRVRLFYATDVHGSDCTFRKSDSAKFYKVDHIIMGGDMMGKFLVPIVDEGGGHHRVSLQGTTEHFEGDDGLAAIRSASRPWVLPHHGPGRRAARHAGRPGRDRHRLPSPGARTHRALDRPGRERLTDTPIKWYVTGGNDDPPDILTVFDEVQSEHVVNSEGRVVLFDDFYPMANCGTPTPLPGTRLARPTRSRSTACSSRRSRA